MLYFSSEVKSPRQFSAVLVRKTSGIDNITWLISRQLYCPLLVKGKVAHDFFLVFVFVINPLLLLPLEKYGPNFNSFFISRRVYQHSLCQRWLWVSSLSDVADTRHLQKKFGKNFGSLLQKWSRSAVSLTAWTCSLSRDAHCESTVLIIVLIQTMHSKVHCRLYGDNFEEKLHQIWIYRPQQH
jgi:hypothetical protein